jgi:hypothetical protein
MCKHCNTHCFMCQQQQQPAAPEQQPEQEPEQQPEQAPQQAPQHPQHVYSDMMPGMRVFAEIMETRLGALETLVETRLDALETRHDDLERRRRRDRDFQRATSAHILAALRQIAPSVRIDPDPAPPQDTDDDDDGDAGSAV